jgi:hypothetical protein
MKHGLSKFEYHLDRLEQLLAKASTQKNPGLWLYRNNGRTPLFMLEGLAKLYSGIHNKKKFEKLKARFKELEDAIGQVDYYDAFAKEFVGNKKIPAAITKYLQAQSREKVQSLNEILKEDKWIGEKADRIKKIRKKLSKADWQYEKQDIESIHSYYVTAINKILEFLSSKDYKFVDVENDLHESRRMLRWLSIYPQALRGSVQLTKTADMPETLAKYQTESITRSPYNVMPDAGEQQYFLLLDQSRFYALSWMIAELGNLKDSGLKVEAIQEALLQTSKQTEKQALTKAYKLAGAKQKTIEQLLEEAGTLCKTFCREKNLEQLLIGTAAPK